MAAFKVREIRKMKNEAVVRPRTRVRKSRRAIFYNEAYLDFFLPVPVQESCLHGASQRLDTAVRTPTFTKMVSF